MLTRFSVSTLCDPVDYSSAGSSIQGIPGKNTGVGCHALPTGDLPDQGIKHTSLKSPALAGGFNATWDAQNSP